MGERARRCRVHDHGVRLPFLVVGLPSIPRIRTVISGMISINLISISLIPISLIPIWAILFQPAVFSQESYTVSDSSRVSDTEGDFDGELSNADYFGQSLALLGDVDGDGVVDVAAGADGDDDGGASRGAVWILFLNDDGTVEDYQKISDTEGEFTGDLDDDDHFGRSVAALGDLNGDGVPDLAVGAPNDDDENDDSGAVWILFLEDDGTVCEHQKISNTAGEFSGTLDDLSYFGRALSAAGDVNDDLVLDLVVGAPGEYAMFGSGGSAWVLLLNDDGTVFDEQEITDSVGGFDESLSGFDLFGNSVAGIGDLDGDSVVDVAVGNPSDDDGGLNRGALWILFLDLDGTVQDYQKISDEEGGFEGDLDDLDYLAYDDVMSVGDLDEDGVTDLVVSAFGDDDGGGSTGALWVLLMDSDGTVQAEHKISATEGEFDGELKSSDRFGSALVDFGDLDEDGVVEWGVGTSRYDDGGLDRGAFWVLSVTGAVDFMRGDVNGDGIVSALIDSLALLEWFFASGEEPGCLDAADIDDNGLISPLLDALFVLQWAFLSGDAPPDPGIDECASDPTSDDVRCETPSGTCS